MISQQDIWLRPMFEPALLCSKDVKPPLTKFIQDGDIPFLETIICKNMEFQNIKLCCNCKFSTFLRPVHTGDFRCDFMCDFLLLKDVKDCIT